MESVVTSPGLLCVKEENFEMSNSDLCHVERMFGTANAFTDSFL